MVKGVGIDAVTISDIFTKCDDLDAAFVRRTFSTAEIEEAEARHNQAEYFAGRFAVKEAVFKAVAHLTAKGTYDLRIVETLADANGRPVVCPNERFQAVLDEAGITSIHVSITNEGDLAIAVAVVE